MQAFFTPSPFQPCMYVNPVYAAAYQAAYAAAYAACVGQGSAQSMQYYGAYAPMLYASSSFGVAPPGGMNAFGEANAQGYGMQGLGMQGMQYPAGHAFGGGGAAPRRQGSDGTFAAMLANLRQRRGGGGGGGGGAAHRHLRPQPRRVRGAVINLRVSARTILQVLVFIMLLYPHFTWGRFAVFAGGALLLWVASVWAPLQRALMALHEPAPRAAPAPPVPPEAGPAAAAREQGENGAVPAVGNAAAAPRAGAAGAAGAARPAPRGILHEILVLIIGFMTSLLPGFNYNPEDAAAFAVAQAIAAREEEQERAQDQDGGDAAAAAAGGGDAGGGQPPAGEADAVPAPA